METLGNIYFYILLIVIVIFLIGITITNSVYFSQIYTEGSDELSHQESEQLIILNVIIIITLFFSLGSIIYMISSTSKSKIALDLSYIKIKDEEDKIEIMIDKLDQIKDKQEKKEKTKNIMIKLYRKLKKSQLEKDEQLKKLGYKVRIVSDKQKDINSTKKEDKNKTSQSFQTYHSEKQPYQDDKVVKLTDNDDKNRGATSKIKTKNEETSTYETSIPLLPEKSNNDSKNGINPYVSYYNKSESVGEIKTVNSLDQKGNMLSDAQKHNDDSKQSYEKDSNTQNITISDLLTNDNTLTLKNKEPDYNYDLQIPEIPIVNPSYIPYSYKPSQIKTTNLDNNLNQSIDPLKTKIEYLPFETSFLSKTQKI